MFVQDFVESYSRLVCLVGLTLILFISYKVVSAALRSYNSPWRDIPGPRRLGWFKGAYEESPEHESSRLQEQWLQQYGHIDKIMTSDTKALSHILSQGSIYQKSPELRFILGELLGTGLLFVEGAKHKQQRRIMNPAFGPIQVRKFTETFIGKAIEMRDIWLAKAAETTRKDGRLKLDAFNWLNRVTLDIIGLAGFNYEFDALNSTEDHPNELSEAVRKMFSFRNLDPVFMLQIVFPPARIIPTARSREAARCLRTIRRVGMQMIAEKKAEVLAAASNVGKDGAVERKDIQGHDLLSLLIKSNMAVDQAESSRMSDDDILSQVPTFLVAGHETTSTGVSWTLFALAMQPAAQATLRAELSVVPTDTPTMDELNALPYLEGVLRESLRLYAPVTATERVAMQDDVIPLSKPFVDKAGVVRHEISVPKGSTIMVPIQHMHRMEELWGEDADEFKPERWASIPDSARTIPNVWGNMLTFLAGAHACIGYRFSVVEMKALIFTIVRAFEIELAVTPDDIVKRTRVVARPGIGSNPSAGSTLPVLLRPVATAK
ncbi:cytochrome P450 [Auriscalpium vulgare]|uniref:Cytochrome P450 n=1 Tax=Auriscalpium vulgare TaxID=40419 RepID=A0ACB8RIC8_9AGAM|nr:cytochrome P450 [Auriscalpium vulgare]